MYGDLSMETFRLPDLGDVTEENAHDKLAEQLAAVAAASMAIQAAVAASEGPREWSPAGALPDKLQKWLDELRANIRQIVQRLPEVESYAISAGLPSGVAATVTFAADPRR